MTCFQFIVHDSQTSLLSTSEVRNARPEGGHVNTKGGCPSPSLLREKAMRQRAGMTEFLRCGAWQSDRDNTAGAACMCMPLSLVLGRRA